MDELDQLEDRHAAEMEFERRQREAEAAKQASRPQVDNCVECDELLPELRKQMHCNFCVDCQALRERRQKLFLRGL